MIKLTIKHEGETLEGHLPNSWQELTVKQYIGLNSKLTEAQLVSLLSGLDLSFIENTSTDLEPVIARLNEWFGEIPPDMKELKRVTISMEGKVINFASSINFTKFGQQSMVKNLIQEHNNLEVIVPDVFAIYAQPIIDGKFDSTRIEAIKGLVNQLPIMQVYPHVLFFFKKLKRMKLHLLTK